LRRPPPQATDPEACDAEVARPLVVEKAGDGAVSQRRHGEQRLCLMVSLNVAASPEALLPQPTTRNWLQMTTKIQLN